MLKAVLRWLWRKLLILFTAMLLTIAIGTVAMDIGKIVGRVIQ